MTAQFLLTNVVKTNAGRRKGTTTMHSLLTGREQELAAAPKHQAPLKNLGIGPLLKSQTHAAALHESLHRGSNHHTHSNAPRDPKGFIRRASPDMTLTPAQRQRAQREESRHEAEQLRRMSEARTNGGITDDEEEIGPDGYPVSSGSSLSKSMHKGSFQRLRTSLNTFMKARSSDHADDFTTRYGMPAAHVAHVAGRTAVVKPTIAALSKSIEATRQRVQTTLGVSPMRNLNQKMQSIARKLGNEQLAKSISGGNLGGLRSAMPRYTAPQVEAAAGAALAHGAIDAQSAQVIANSLALGGVGAVPSALMAKLRGE